MPQNAYSSISMSPTNSYLARQRARLEKEIALLHAELTRIKIAQQAIARLEPSPKNADGVKRVNGAHSHNSSDTKSIKEMVLEVLKEVPEGIKAIDLLESINAVYSVKLERTSLSPQLSRLKKEEKIFKKGLLWYPQHREQKGGS